jgi:hypothetical protein
MKVFYFIEVLDEIRLFIDKKVIFGEKKFLSVCRSKFVSTTSIRIDFVPHLDLNFLKNPGSGLKPSIGFHTKFWAFSGFLKI